jgi:hypothetical protein
MCDWLSAKQKKRMGEERRSDMRTQKTAPHKNKYSVTTLHTSGLQLPELRDKDNSYMPFCIPNLFVSMHRHSCSN